MKTNYEIRYAAHPEDAKGYDTQRIRRDFLMEKVFSDNEVNMVYSMYDRMIVGGARPVGEVLKLEAIDPLKAPYFLTRREMGIFNVGGPGVVKAGDAVFELDYKEALYLGSGDREVTFESKDVICAAWTFFSYPGKSNGLENSISLFHSSKLPSSSSISMRRYACTRKYPPHFGQTYRLLRTSST